MHGTYHELNTENQVVFGSAENGMLVEDLTRGHFKEGFKGCIGSIRVQGGEVGPVTHILTYT